MTRCIFLMAGLASVAHACEDGSWHKKGSPEKACAWVAEKPDTRCRSKSDYSIFAFEACKSTCGACDHSCEDSSDWHKKGSPEKDCAWVSRQANRMAIMGEDGKYAYQACAWTSGTCNVDDVAQIALTCEDGSWFKKGSPEKDCAWVATKPDTRCRAKSDTSIFAFEACQSTCGACDQKCVEKSSWHKKNYPAKDCEWVSRASNRMVTMGENGMYAYEDCRWTSKTCDIKVAGVLVEEKAEILVVEGEDDDKDGGEDDADEAKDSGEDADEGEDSGEDKDEGEDAEEEDTEEKDEEEEDSSEDKDEEEEDSSEDKDEEEEDTSEDKDEEEKDEDEDKDEED